MRNLKALLTAFLLSNLLTLPTLAQGSPVKDAEPYGRDVSLSLKSPLERQLSGGETQAFYVEAEAGQALSLSVEQRDIDVAVSLFDASGRKLNVSDRSFGTTGAEKIFFVADRAGKLRVEVHSTDKSAKRGAYVVELSERRQATEKDRRESVAFIKLTEADEALREGTAESYKTALQKYDEAAEIWRGLGDDEGQGLVLQGKTVTFYSMGEMKPAFDAAQASLPLWRKAGRRDFEADALLSLGTISTSLGEREKALEYFEQAQAIWRELKNPLGEGKVLSEMTVAYYLMGDFRRSLRLAEEALPLRRAAQDLPGTGGTLNGIGVLYQKLGEPEKAVEAYEQALAIYKEIGDNYSTSVTLGNLGDLWRDRGDLDRALEYIQQALELQRRIGNKFTESKQVEQLGRLHLLAGEYERALDLFQQSLELARAANNRDTEVTTLSFIGEVYADTGNYDKSNEQYTAALALARTLKDDYAVADELNHIAANFNALGRSDDAIDYARQAKEIFDKVGFLQGQAECFRNIGLALERKGDHARALENHRQYLALAEQIHNRFQAADANYLIALALRDAGDMPGASGAVEKAINIAESVRSNITNKERRAAYFAGYRKYYELDIELLLSSAEKTSQLESAEKTSQSDAVARSLETSEAAKARVLLELLNESGAGIRSGADPQLLKRERELLARLDAKAERRTRFLSEGKTRPEELAAIAREITELSGELEQTKARIRQTSPRYAALVEPRPLCAREIQGLLDRDTVLLEYSLGDAESFVWLVTPDAVSVQRLPKRDEIEAGARRFHESLRSNTDDGREAATVSEALGRMLLGPVADGLRGKRIVVVAEGALQYVPFAALKLPNSKTEGEASKSEASFLNETNEVVNLPSVSTLAALRAQTANRKSATKAIAVFADPVFNAADPRVKKAQSETAHVQKNDALQRSLEETATGEDDLQSIPRLPFSRREAEAILSGVPASDALKAVDFAASTSNVTGESLSNYRVIHFATHGLLNSHNPELSGLVLSLVDEKGEPLNGFLRLNDIYNLRLNSDLVVLSACQTALGRDVRGEGLIGLTRGFMYAGAPRVVASLWKVDDAATAELMKRFYQGMFQKRLRPADALRAAQNEMARDARWRSPYFWAAFTLQGEWK